MSSLGAKVKELFSSSDSQAAARGEVDPNTPGSFPVDDMRPKEDQDTTTTTGTTTTGHEHNKLHKANDPRGFSEGDDASRGHGYKDSGVGLTDSSVPHREVTSSNPNPSKPSETSESRETSKPLETSKPFETSERTIEPVSDRRLDDTTSQLTSDVTGGTGETSGKEHTPYWGDIPQGQGVYNTVTGHGSGEDTTRPEGLHSGAQDTTGSSQLGSGIQGQSSSQTTDPFFSQRDTQNPDNTLTGHGSVENTERIGGITQGQGVYNTVAGHGSAEDTERTGSGTQGQSQTTDPLSSQRDTRNPDGKTSGSHLTEGLGGAAALGAGAYGLNKSRQGNETAPYQGSNDAATAAARAAFINKGTEPHSSQQKPTLGSGTATNLPRQDQTSDPYDSQRAVHNPEEKNSGSRFAEGLTGATAGTAGVGAYEHHKHRKDDETTKPVEESQESKGRSFPLLHRDHKDKEVKEHKHEKEPKDKSGGLFHRSHKDEVKPESSRVDTEEDKHHRSKAAAALGAAGVGGATYGATRNRHDDDNAKEPTTLGRYKDSSASQGPGQHDEASFVNQPSGAGYGTSQGYTTQTGHSQDPLARDSTSQQQGTHGHRGAELGTAAAAAGLGAGALASHHNKDKNQDSTAYGTQSGQSTDPLARDFAHQQVPGAFGSQSAFGTQGKQSTGPLARDPTQQQTSSGFGTQSAYGSQTNQPTNPLARDSSQQHDSSHRGTGLAAGAAAAGLGAGALASHHGTDKHQDSTAYGTQSNQSTNPLTRDPDQSSYGTQTSGAGYLPIQTHNTQSGQSQDPLARDSSAQHEGSHKSSGLATGAAAGLGAGALASHGHHGHQDSTRQGQDAFGTRGTQSSGIGADLNYRGSSSQYGQPTNPLASDSQREDSHRGTGVATGAAAGLGAAALASHGHHGHQDSTRQGQDTFGTQGNQSSGTGLDPLSRSSGAQYGQSTNPLASDSQHEDSHRGTGLATGAAAGLGAGALASHGQHGNTQDSSRGYQPESGISSRGLNPIKDESFTDKRTFSDSNPPVLTQHANEGQYNTLASGTPSGVRIEDTVDSTQSIGNTRSTHVDTQDKHFGAGAAGLGAAAAGAGTAAYLSRDKDEKKNERLETEKPKTGFESKEPVTRDFASTTGTSGTSKPVIHKCQKCGEDNDISKYFTGKN
ncbi:hypothetical protein B0J13DRAFT_560315 [Dactylonectria estremocensis]|uniref:Uncharacterized protein n=1 Tax=Dactylonectria estremocensis TaxID=1079267 RepID=A0A9P9IZT7_9HYPO|nr:hypothetical protein B0J13DRAFT_560315 [Dactylonectria estremocensis]